MGIIKRIIRKAKRLFLEKAPAPARDENDAYYKNFSSKIPSFRQQLASIKSSVAFSSPDLYWHPYDILSNFSEFDDLLTGKNRDVHSLCGNLPVADIGAADGDLSFFLEHCGIKNIHILEYAPTSCNRLEGARLLKEKLSSGVTIHEIDVDSMFQMPVPRWGMVFFLGTFYHLKNPYYLLEKLARCSNYCMLSTRITRFSSDNKTDLSKIPCAYLLYEGECNNDTTNYWVFSEAGLKRIIERTGWEIGDFMTCGSDRSTPVSMEHSRRAFCLLRTKLRPGSPGN